MGKTGALYSGNPQRANRDLAIADMRMQGMTTRQIAKEVGLTSGRISQIINDQAVKSKIDDAVRFYALHADSVAIRQIELCHDEDKAVSQKAITEYNKVMGLSTSHTSVFIQNAFNVAGNLTLSPDVAGLISDLQSNKKPESCENPDIIDVDAIDVDFES